MTTAAEKRWYQAVAELETCSLCGKWGIQVAHGNEGKGMGKKVEYYKTAAICYEEHHEIDNGNKLSRDERRNMMRDAQLDTLWRLIANGRLKLS